MDRVWQIPVPFLFLFPYSFVESDVSVDTGFRIFMAGYLWMPMGTLLEAHFMDGCACCWCTLYSPACWWQTVFLLVTLLYGSHINPSNKDTQSRMAWATTRWPHLAVSWVWVWRVWLKKMQPWSGQFSPIMQGLSIHTHAFTFNNRFTIALCPICTPRNSTSWISGLFFSNFIPSLKERESPIARILQHLFFFPIMEENILAPLLRLGSFLSWKLR